VILTQNDHKLSKFSNDEGTDWFVVQTEGTNFDSSSDFDVVIVEDESEPRGYGIANFLGGQIGDHNSVDGPVGDVDSESGTTDGETDDESTTDSFALETNATGNDTAASVDFTVTNQQSVDSATILEISIPDSWSVESHTDGDATWSSKNTDGKWLWQTVTAGESKSTSASFSYPVDENTTNFTVTATVKNQSGTILTKDVTISTEQKSVQQAVAGSDGKVGDMDILNAIDQWRTGAEVPNAGGQKIGDLKLLKLIDQWRNGGSVS
jgi:hypothetical protein